MYSFLKQIDMENLPYVSLSYSGEQIIPDSCPNGSNSSLDSVKYKLQKTDFEEEVFVMNILILEYH